MKIELQEQLFNNYPKLFVRRHLPKTESAMCYGIQCPDQWYDLLDSLCALIRHRSISMEFICEATQVKTKFGGLRFYVTYADDYIKGAINMAEQLSRNITE
tara:strand:- start:95 stop:397 length:303 start_codon:yes stop_codon:yes gene_type:complete